MNRLASFIVWSRARLVLPDDDEGEGQAMVEYALILVLVAIVVIVTLILIGNQIRNMWTNIQTGLSAQ